ncbi:hypothetical protein MK079_00710 [Candidatus Gracilibacteria bacterium]|nr:hypothetical protein [Candidatus Gracilibacteria bacterium]
MQEQTLPSYIENEIQKIPSHQTEDLVDFCYGEIDMEEVNEEVVKCIINILDFVDDKENLIPEEIISQIKKLVNYNIVEPGNIC